MPVALISRGIAPGQNSVVGILENVYRKAAEHQNRVATSKILGVVINLKEKLK